MLPKSKITKTKMLTDAWYDQRIGKFTSSEIHFIMGEKFLTAGCQSYIYRKAGEIITGKPIRNDIETEATLWGAAEEANAIKKFAKWASIDYIICQQLITENGSDFGSTPDGIIVNGESADKTKYDVSTVEVKCPPTYSGYISLALCETPQDLKAKSEKYYWQVLDQMLTCGSLVGYFVVYHPDFRYGNMRVIEFRKMQESGRVDVGRGKIIEVKYPIANDMKLLEERKKMAVEERGKVLSALSKIGKI